jgi:hypothetical protein
MIIEVVGTLWIAALILSIALGRAAAREPLDPS